MAGFYHLYLPSILQMRSGDIETNPGPNTPESSVSEEEFILLSEHIVPSKYWRLGNRLGMSYVVLKQIKIRSHDDYIEAFMEVFTKWRHKQLPGTNTRAILADELQTCGLGALSGRLLDGSLLSNKTSKPSVPSTSPPSPTQEPLPSEPIQKWAEDFKRKYSVSEEEFILLSEFIDQAKYMRLGNRLGMSYAVMKSFKIQSHDDYSFAFMEVFMKWRNKQLPGTNTKAVLAEELQTCGLGELSGRLLDGSLRSYATSKPSLPPPSPPSPPRQPLPPDLIQKCAEDFKRKYRYTLCKLRADPLNPDSLVQFEEIYSNLVFEEEHRRYKQLLEYTDLVDLKDKSKFTRRLLVQGEAGVGKTTLCAKIAWDWINGEHFQEFEWVIIVPLREAKKYGIGEIAKSYLTSNNPTTASQLTEYMHLNTDKVFIVFDGLDEFDEDDAQPEEDESQTSDLQSSQSQGQSSNPSGSTQYQAEFQSASGKKKVPSAEMKIGVEEILRSEKLETVPVMVTTRPWKAVEIRRNDRLRKNYTFLYVKGFNKENVASYIQKYFLGDNAAAESLIQFVLDNDVISENMAPYPIYIAMLCLMWREFDEEKQRKAQALQTFSQIFEEIFVFLKEHYALKMANPSCSLDESLNVCLKDVNQLLEPIASLALNGLLTNTLVFREGDFERCQDSMKTACRVGVLSEESRIILGKGRRDESNPRIGPTVFFPHKLFQEFMAGIHLASLYETDNREYNRLMETVTGHRKEEFRYLLYFTASQNQRVGIDILTHIGRSIHREDDKHFLVDVAFECHDTQAAAVVRDKVLPENATLEVDRSMTAHTVAGYTFIKTDMACLRVERECGLTISREVAEMICSFPSLRTVELKGQLHNNFFTTIAAQGQFSKVQSLTIKFNPNAVLDASASHDLAVSLGRLPNLTELTLGDVKGLPDEFYSTLRTMATSMKDCFPQITRGNFHFNGTHHESLESFMNAIHRYRQRVSEESYLHSSQFHPQHETADPELQHPPTSPDGDSYVHHSTPEGLTPILTESPLTATLQSQPTITEEPSSSQEADNQDGGSDDKGPKDLPDPFFPSETQEYSELPSLPAQVGDRPESPQPTQSIPSSLIQAPQSTAVLQHSNTQPIPHQGSDSCTSTCMPTSSHYHPQSDDEFVSFPASDSSHSEGSILGQAYDVRSRSGNGQRSPRTVGSSNDLTCTSEYVDSGGKDLLIPSYGFILSIPPGALEEGEWITCKALPSLPDHLKLNSDELIVSPGYQCFPSGLHFKKPVKLIIPHCAVFTDPFRVRTVLIHTDSKRTGEFLRAPLTQDVCKVNHNHFELSLQHFCGGYVIVLYDESAVEGKHMLCMPYLEKVMPTSRKPIMDFCLRNKPHDPALMETRRTDITQHMKDEEDEIFVKYSDLEVNCQLDEDEPIRTVSPVVLFCNSKHQESFLLNLNGKADDTSVTLQLLQDTEKIQKILFRTRFTGVSSSAVEPSTETLKPSREVSDMEYLKLSSEIGTKEFLRIGINLGVSYAKCESVLAEKGKDYTGALMNLFMTWNIKQQQERTDIREVLAVKLEDSELGGLAGKLRRGCLLKKL